MVILEAIKNITITYDLGNLADWISAIGTVAAVIVALFFNYYGILRQDTHSLGEELKEFTNKFNQGQEKRITLLESLVDCLEFISNDKNDLFSKNDYLRAIVPTLKEIRKDLLSDPLVQYRANKIIEKINNNDFLDEKTILKLDDGMSSIAESYRGLLKAEQSKINGEVKELKEKYKDLSKRFIVPKNH